MAGGRHRADRARRLRRRAGLFTVVLIVVGWPSACGDDSLPTYERRDGPRLAGLGRVGLLEYKHSISANICVFDRDPSAARIRRDARRELRDFERLAARSPDELIKTKVAYEMGDSYEDVTLREYAAESAERLTGDSGEPGSPDRECRKRYRERLRAIARHR